MHAAAADWHAAAIHTYDDHRMAMCFSLAAFNGLVTDSAVPVRILDPHCVGKTFPDYFETLFGVVHGPPPGHPRHHHRRPHRLRQRHAGQRGGTRAWATTCWIPARSTA